MSVAFQRTQVECSAFRPVAARMRQGYIYQYRPRIRQAMSHQITWLGRDWDKMFDVRFTQRNLMPAQIADGDTIWRVTSPDISDREAFAWQITQPRAAATVSQSPMFARLNRILQAPCFDPGPNAPVISLIVGALVLAVTLSIPLDPLLAFEISLIAVACMVPTAAGSSGLSIAHFLYAFLGAHCRVGHPTRPDHTAGATPTSCSMAIKSAVKRLQRQLPLAATTLFRHSIIVPHRLLEANRGS